MARCSLALLNTAGWLASCLAGGFLSGYHEEMGARVWGSIVCGFFFVLVRVMGKERHEEGAA